MRRKAMTVSEVIREALLGSGESLASIQRRIGVHSSTLSRFARGERSLTLGTADLLAAHLDLKLVKAGGRG